MIRSRWLIALVCSGLGCSQLSTEPGFTNPDADVRILFVGNSLTYTHDVPRLVRTIGERHGRAIATASIAKANFSLEDHWYSGVAAEIRRLRPDVVVMQQGPSSVGENRLHLARWSKELAIVAREVDGTAALYMVWPDVSRRFAFPDVEAAYAGAAREADARLLPAGSTWLMAWEQDEGLQLYGGDGFHPSYLGAVAAAYTIYAGLFDIDPATLPALANVSAERAALLRDAVAASLQKWAP